MFCPWKPFLSPSHSCGSYRQGPIPATPKDRLTERLRYSNCPCVVCWSAGRGGANSYDGRKAGISYFSKNYSKDCAHQRVNGYEYEKTATNFCIFVKPSYANVRILNYKNKAEDLVNPL